MQIDKFKNPVFNETDIFNAIYLGHIDKLNELMVSDNIDIDQFIEISNINFTKYNSTIQTLNINEFDTALQDKWFMPEKYYTFDVSEFCLTKCVSNVEKERVEIELSEFKNRNLIRLLQWLKYFVDTCLENNVLWGVGRGSSVASYVLFLLGVHKINSIKYNIDYKEFFR